MEIGGYDTIFPTNDPEMLAHQIMSFINWEDFIIEKDEGKDFFYYKNERSKHAWNEDRDDLCLDNTMIYFLVRKNELTVVTDKELTDRIREKFK